MNAQYPERIGRFRVTQILGVGGFGLVVSADDEELGGSVAIKILGQQWAADSEIRQRFIADGRPYLILDLADRGTLSERLVEMQGVDSISVKSIVDALTESLSALHSAGFVHRDVTPKNLLIKRIGSVSRIPNRGAEIGESTDVYAATAVIWNVIAGTPPPENHPMDRALDTIDSEWKAFMSQGLSLDPANRFADMRAWQASAEAAISAGSDFIQTSNAVRYRTDLCPYQGLSSFQPEDANRFFGRDQLVKDLVTRLRNRHVMVVAGASGSGKSSLVRAGLISAVRSGVLPDSDRWPVVLFTPGSDPLAELDYQIAKVLGRLQAQENSLASASSDHRWRAISDTITETAGGGLVCIDQFEELFTFDHHSNVVEEFLLALQAMVEPADSKIHLVLIIRADFYARSSRYPWLAKIINENQLLVGPMSRTELRDAIVTPAKIATLKLDDELVDSVLDEAGSAAGSLPLVSHALVETWKRRSGRRLTIESYRSTGGVAGAIGQSAETLYNEQLTTDQQSAARRLVLRLVSPGEGIPDTRRPIAITDLDGDSHPEVMHDVANALVEARLLTIDRNTIQLAHEAIITSWPRLRDWINDSREDLRIQQRIERASAEWLESDRNPDLLYRGTPLTAARDWQSKRGQDLNIQEREFLDTAADREHANLARAQAAAQRIRTQRRLAFTTLTILTVAALVLSVVAFTAFHRATNNEKAANQRLAQALASQAVELVNQNPRLALALAAEVIERTEQPPVEARIALVNATNSLSATPYTPASIPKVVGDTLTVGVHPSEEFVVTGNRDGSVAFWTAQGQASGEPFKAHDGAVEEIVFSKNGAQMLTAGLGGKVMRWDLSNQGLPSSPTEMIDLNSILWSVAVSAETGRLATATEDGKIRLFDLNNMTELAVMVDLDRDFISVQFSPDGHLLFAGNGRGEVWSWQVSTGEQLLTPFRAHQSDIWEIVFHPEKAIFVTASSDGRVRIWNLETGALINEPFTGVAENVRGVQISKNGLLIAGDENGRILFWDINSQTFKGATTASHNSQVIDASLQQNGSLH